MMKSLLALNALNFFMADVRDGLGPFLGVFLQEKRCRRPRSGRRAAMTKSCHRPSKVAKPVNADHPRGQARFVGLHRAEH
jgi:hypothetical protein